MLLEAFSDLDKVTQIVTILSFLLTASATFLLHPVRHSISRFFSFFTSPFLFFNKLEKQIYDVQKEIKTTAEYIKDAVCRIETSNQYILNRILIMLHEDPMPVFEADKSGEYVWVNNAYMKMSGKPFQDLNGFGWLNTITPKYRDKVRNEWNLSIKEERSFDMDYVITGSLGEYIPVHTKTYPMKDLKGEILGHMGFVKKSSGTLSEFNQ